MEATLVHFAPEQKERLRRRARRRGKSFSNEVREAVEIYLTLPVETREELAVLASEARQSTRRTVARLDQAITSLDRVLKRLEKNR